MQIQIFDMAYHVIIPAAGSGSRMAASKPKQYLLLNGQPIIAHVLTLFSHVDCIKSVHLILSQDDADWAALHLALNTKVQVHFCGGETRSSTVLNGLHAIQDQVASDDWILVHDAARPGLTMALLHQLIENVGQSTVGGLLALPLADTLKRADQQQKVLETIPRNDLWQAQTPQMFRYHLLKEALMKFKGAPTDEAEAIEALGLHPILVQGALQNLKVTYPQDLAVLSALLNYQE